MWHKWWSVRPTVRPHANVPTCPDVAVNTAVQRMREVYATARIGVELVSTENVNLPTLSDVDVGVCVRGNRRPSRTSSLPAVITPQQRRRGVFVSVTATPVQRLRRPSRRPPRRSRSATQWTLGHEVGHVLNLRHVNDNDRIMTGNGTGNITNPPPDLINTEVTTMIIRDQ